MPLALAEQVLAGKRRAVARLITQIENNRSQAQPALSYLYPHTGRAHLVGITGAPGTGKSSLIGELAKACRRKDRTVAVLAVDPTSPFSGGAVLGDRIRMRDLTGDPGVFIRSMATRGGVGGLAWAVDDAVKVLDAAGFNIIMVETVGAGQNEVDIVRIAHTVVVVEAPGMGDEVQTIKAGLLEIADIFIVNKADRPDVERTVTALRQMLELGHAPTGKILHHDTLMTVDGPPPVDSSKTSDWQIPVLKTMALKGEGIDRVIDAIEQHYHYLQTSGELAERNRTRLTDQLENILKTELMHRLVDQLPASYLSETICRLLDRDLTPYEAAQMILKKVDSG